MQPDWLYAKPFRRKPEVNGAIWFTLLGAMGAGIGFAMRCFGLWE